MSATSLAPRGAIRRYAARGSLIQSATAPAFTRTLGSAPFAGPAVAATNCAGPESDFNGDRIRDTAIADPAVTVGLQVGRSALGSPEYFTGSIDEVRAYNSAVDAQAVVRIAAVNELTDR